MEIQLKDLIEKVKSEGINEGKQQAQEIKKAAEGEAESIIIEAHKKADLIISQAKSEAEKLKIEAENSIRIALRDLILKFQIRIKELFNSVILKEVKGAYTADLLKTVMVDLIRDWNKDEESDIELKIAKDDCNKLFDFLHQKLSEYLKKGIKINPDPSLDSGFVISLKNGAMCYDFSAKTITEIIAVNLEPEITKLLNETTAKD